MRSTIILYLLLSVFFGFSVSPCKGQEQKITEKTRSEVIQAVSDSIEVMPKRLGIEDSLIDEAEKWIQEGANQLQNQEGISNNLKREVQSSTLDSIKSYSKKLGVSEDKREKVKEAVTQGQHILNNRENVPEMLEEKIQSSAKDSIMNLASKLGVNDSVAREIRRLMDPSRKTMSLKKEAVQDSLFVRLKSKLPKEKAWADSARKDLEEGYATFAEQEQITEQDLPMLNGQVLQDSLVNEAQNIQKKYLEDKIKLQTSRITDSLQWVNIQEISSFKERSYFEGIFSIPDVQTFDYMSLVPAFGYGLFEKWSLGAGIDYTFNTENIKDASVGIKSFAKWHTIPDKLYLQLENTSMLKQLKQDAAEKGEGLLKQQVPALGVGGLFPISEDKSINLSLFRKLYNTKDLQGLNMPWMARIGMSFF